MTYFLGQVGEGDMGNAGLYQDKWGKVMGSAGLYQDIPGQVGESAGLQDKWGKVIDTGLAISYVYAKSKLWGDTKCCASVSVCAHVLTVT